MKIKLGVLVKLPEKMMVIDDISYETGHNDLLAKISNIEVEINWVAFDTIAKLRDSGLNKFDKFINIKDIIKVVKT